MPLGVAAPTAMSLEVTGKIGGKPAVGADGEQCAVLTIKAAHERAPTFLAELMDSDGLAHLQRGGRGPRSSSITSTSINDGFGVTALLIQETLAIRPVRSLGDIEVVTGVPS